MPEGIEGAVLVVPSKPEPPPIVEKAPVAHTPLTIPPKTTISTKEQELLAKLASYGEPTVNDADQVPKDKDIFKVRMDEIRQRAHDLAKRSQGYSNTEIPTDLKEELANFKNNFFGEVTTLFRDYYNDSLGSEEGKVILKFLNPTLTDEEAAEAHRAYIGYESAKKSIGGKHKEDWQELSERYRPIMEANKEILAKYGLVNQLFSSFADSDYSHPLVGFLEYEMSQLGLLSKYSIKHRANIAKKFNDLKGTELFNKFFDGSTFNNIEEEIYEDAMRVCFNPINIPDRSRVGTDWYRIEEAAREPGYAIEYLANHPTPQVVRRLIAINAFDVHRSERWDRNGSYYQVHKDGYAMKALLTTQEHTNWDDVVRKTISVYPELKDIETELRLLHVTNPHSVSSRNEFPRLSILEYAFEKKYLIPLRLKLLEGPDDEDLNIFLSTKNIEIGVSDLANVGLLTKEESQWISKIPFEVKYDRKGNNSIEREALAPLCKADIAQEERDAVTEKLKRLAFVSQKVSESGMLDKQEINESTIKFFKCLLDPTLSNDQIEFVTQKYAKFFHNTHIPSAFSESRDQLDGNEHHPLLLRFLFESQQTQFIYHANHYEWRTAFGDQGMMKWKEIDSKSFIKKSSGNDWKEIYGETGLMEWVKQAPNDFVNKATLEDWKEVFGEDAFKKWIEIAPKDFVMKAGKEEWKQAFGEEAVNRFLSILPSETEERRNAFLHNDYDRTTEFIDFLLNGNNTYKDYLTLTAQDFGIITDYVAQFGLSRDFHLFHYFKQLSLLEASVIEELPPDIVDSGLTSKQELIDAVERMKVMVYGEEPIMEVSNLTPFELANLRVVTGKASHRFDNGRPSFQQIVEDFERDVKKERIAPVPEGYKAETIQLRDTKIEFDPTDIQSDYERLASNLTESLWFETGWSTFKDEAAALIEARLKTIGEELKTADGKKKEFLDKDNERFQTYVKNLDQVDSLDSLMRVIVQVDMGRAARPEMNDIFRKLIFKTVLSQNKNLASELAEIFKHKRGEITVEKVTAIVNLIKDPIKEHVVNMKGGLEEYWSEETVKAMRDNKHNLREIFDPHYQKLKDAIDNFKVSEQEGGQEVRVIPDRGFIGEMSGYLADVCYTAEYPLLRGRDVVPYKFVAKDKVTGSPKFIGSVLVFEVDTADGEGALMVRGFDVPDETNYDVTTFIEKFLDKMTDVARVRGKRRVILPGATGAISNYHMTIKHITNTYGRNIVSLADRFAFNGYDVTKNSFIARELPPTPLSSEVETQRNYSVLERTN